MTPSNEMLRKYLRKTTLTKRQRAVAAHWLREHGWEESTTQYDTWLEPTRRVDWSLAGALMIEAETAAATRLKAGGWEVFPDPAAYGPGDWPRCRRPTGGHWVTLAHGLKCLDKEQSP